MPLPGALWARSKLAEWRARPFGRLCLHFLQALTQSGQESEQLEFGAAALLALLAIPGVFASFFLFSRYSTLMDYFHQRPPQDVFLVSMADKYSFIVFSMTITGLVVVFKWDRILPSKQDYFNLVSLPLPAVRVYLASLLAALLAAGIFALDVNLGSTFFFPLVVMASVKGASFLAFLTFMLTHALVVILASLFTFFACFSVMTAALALLPAAVFARIAVPLRVTLIVGLLAMLVSNTVIPEAILHSPDAWYGGLPPVWFVALYQQVQLSGPPQLLPYAERAGWGLLASVVSAALTSWLAYHRYFRRIPEMSDDGAASLGAPAFGWKLARLFLLSPVQQGLYGFSLRALLRSETHLLVVGGLVGLGLLLVIEAAMEALRRRPPADGLPSLSWLSVPLILAYLLPLAVRFSFEIPAHWKANWVFAYLLDSRDHPAPAVARKLLFTAILPLVVVTGVVFGWAYRPAVGAVYAIYLFLVTMMLVELLVVDFRKVPFTCSLPPFRNDTLVVILSHLVGFGVFTAGGALLASAMYRSPLRFALLATILTLFWGSARFWLGEVAAAESLQFTAKQEAVLQTLDLADRA